MNPGTKSTITKSTITKSISMLLLSILVMILLVMIVLGFMLGFTHPLPWLLIVMLIAVPFIHDHIVSRRFLHWQPKMSTGIELVDRDHKVLLGLINQLQTATLYRIDDRQIEKTLDELVDYTRYHFAREEELLALNQYPDLQAHKQAHQQMIDKIAAFVERYHADQSLPIAEVVDFLKAWLIEHIMRADMAYVPYIRVKN